MITNTNTITIPKQYKHEYICCIPKQYESIIMNAIKKVIASELLTDDEKREALENANSSKVCDLTPDTINIKFV